MFDIVMGALLIGFFAYWIIGIGMDSWALIGAGCAILAVFGLGVAIDMGNEAINRGERVRQACAMIPDAIFTDDLSCVLPNGTVVK